jgi:hypothetical protein
MARVLKAALVRLDGEPNAIEAVAFQYNPEKLRRQLAPRAGLAPLETISCVVVFDATDALETGDQATPFAAEGVRPALAALELLLHEAEPEPPGFWDRLFGRSRPSTGPPIALFVWGVQRAVPVRVTQLDITEELHDRELRPLRATVRLRMQVVTDGEVSRDHPAANRWLSYVVKTRAAAALGYTDTVPGFE